MMKNKIIAIIVTIMIIMPIFPTASFASGTATDILNTAYGECDLSTGYKQQEHSGYTKYGEWMGSAYMDWCAAFVAWCANQAGVSSSVVPHYSFVNDMINFYSNKGLYFSSSSYTPKAGDLAFLKDFEHVAIVISSDGNTVKTIEGNTSKPDFTGDSLYVSIKTRSMSYYKGFATPAYSREDTEPPSNATLSINKTVFSVGETVCFSSSCNIGASYTIGIDKDGTRIYTGVVGNYFEKSFSEPGDYSAYVSAWNSMGLVDSNRVNFTVYNSAPSTSKLSIDKSVVVVGEAITFNCEAKNATGYTIGIYKGKERILTQDIGQTFVKSFTEPGEYSAYISAWNANGLVDSNYVGWVVYDSAPTSSELKIDKKAICVGDSIQFTCISKEATGYTIGINKDGVRIFTQDISKVFTKSFNEAGLYTAYVTSWNTRGICDSKKINFEVYNTVPDNCNLIIDKNIVEVGNSVKLKFDAHNAKLFEVGTYINGERVWITPARGDYNELNLEIINSGIYEVWATSYNEYGYCDSEHITFIAYDGDNAVVLKNNNSVRVTKKLNINKNNYSCIIALYEDGKMVNFKNKSNLNGTTILDETILCSDEYDEIKIMLWDGLSTLKPLCEAEEIPSSKWIVE